MQEPYKKGLATHLGPESCAGSREGTGEALARVHAGEVSSSDISQYRRADHVRLREGHMSDDDRTRAVASTPRSLRPSACMETS